MSYVLNAFVIVFLVILQTTLAREITLFQGSVDLVLVWLAAWALNSRDHSTWLGAVLAFSLFGYISALPWYVYLITYVSIILLANYIRSKLWQSPLVSMFLITIIGSLIYYLMSYLVMRFSGGNYQWNTVLTNVVLPSLTLNILLAAPIHTIVHDMMGWTSKEEVLE